MRIDEPERGEEARLDGCYVLKTDLTGQRPAAETDRRDVRDRYTPKPPDDNLAHGDFRVLRTERMEMGMRNDRRMRVQWISIQHFSTGATPTGA